MCEAAMTMNVNLSPQLEAMVKAKVASSRYTSASEVVREALRLMERQDQLKELQLEHLREEIQNGLTSGEPISWNPEAIKAEGRALLQAWAPSNQDDCVRWPSFSRPAPRRFWRRSEPLPTGAARMLSRKRCRKNDEDR